MSKIGFEGMAEANRDIPNEKNPKHSFEGNDEENLAEPSTQGGGPSDSSEPSTKGPSGDDD